MKYNIHIHIYIIFIYIYTYYIYIYIYYQVRGRRSLVRGRRRHELGTHICILYTYVHVQMYMYIYIYIIPSSWEALPCSWKAARWRPFSSHVHRTAGRRHPTQKKKYGNSQSQRPSIFTIYRHYIEDF